MPLDRRAQRMLDMMALSATAGNQRQTASERRADFRKLMDMATRPVPVARFEKLALPGRGGPLAVGFFDAATARPKPAPVLVFFHGGGLVAGNIDTHAPMCASLAVASGAVIVSVDYRLAPEAPYPAAVEDALGAVRWISDHADEMGLDAARLAVGGDSAGAGLAAVVCAEARASGPRIAAQLLLCPVLDMTGSQASRREFAKGFLIDATVMARDLEDYAPGADPGDPRLSPLFTAEPGGLPPTIIHTAEFDPLRDEGEAHAKRLAQAGVAVSLTRHDGLIHSFYSMNAIFPQAEQTLQAIGAELRHCVG
jgi:acetyl esterase